ncbi:catechol 2,3-dioxygenase [Micromonospora sp. NPDC023814]|uniref:catechol 2,3-dioxygenase n=1 Tax=Micromonospora sp. NPDC023814 TaxID=3154596 RepID=UPI0033F16855
MGVLRMGYVHARVTDLEKAKQHYGDTMGLYPVLVEDGTAYFKGWDEWDHHSVVLEEGGVGVAKFGFKVADPADIERFEDRATRFGCAVSRMSAGENREVSDGIRIVLPSEHVVELYHDMTVLGTEVGTHNPEVFPRHLVGIGAPRLDHALITAEDVNLMERFFREVLDFYPSERLATSLDADADCIATWLTVGNTVHDIAILKGPNAKLHHFAFELSSWSDILRAGDLMAMDDVPVDVGPTRHGITRGQTIYFFDPSGNRNEVFSGGYVAYPDRPCVTWTPDQLEKGVFYISREVNDRFTAALT